MDEADTEDVAAFNRAAEDARIIVKETDLLPTSERCNVLESQEIVRPREGDNHRSSIREFVDMLDGNCVNSGMHLLDTSGHRYVGSLEGGDERVKELTLRIYNAMLSSMNESEVMKTMQLQQQFRDRPDGAPEAGSSHGLRIHKDNGPAKVCDQEDVEYSPCVELLAAQPLDRNNDIVSDQSTRAGSDAVIREAFPSEGVRMKIISKAGHPEYLVKSTLKGKGVLYRAPISTKHSAGSGGQNFMKGASATTSSSDSPVNVKETPVLPAAFGALVSGTSDIPESSNDGITLREWIETECRNVQKVDILSIFKQILDLIHSLHSEGKVLQDLRPSCLKLLSSKHVKYCGCLAIRMEMHESIKKTRSQTLKRPVRHGTLPLRLLRAKRQKLSENMDVLKAKSQFLLGCDTKSTVENNVDVNFSRPGSYGYEFNEKSRLHVDPKTLSSSIRPQLSDAYNQHLSYATIQLEEEWYRSPEDLFGRSSTFASNIYRLGVLLFELLSCFESGEARARAMSDLRHRILPPKFLSENPKEAGFCLWLLHPEHSLRPTIRDILQSEMMTGFQELCGDDVSFLHEDEIESELLLHFLTSLKERKNKQALKLVEDLRCIEADVKELEKRHMLRKSPVFSSTQGFLHDGQLYSPDPSRTDSRFLKNVGQLESAYFSTRSRIQESGNNCMIREDTNLLNDRANWHPDQKAEEKPEPLDCIGAFFDGLCKYARYSKLEVCGTLRNRDFTNSTNVICSLSFDRDEDYFAAAGVSKKIKIFEFQALYDNSVDVHYPAIEMENRSKLSCVCWNGYVRNYLASTDYDGVVKLWDASTGQAFCQYTEHERRAWSVDFSQLDPMNLASGSDDCTVKLWSIHQRNSLYSIRNIANVCCVQFSGHSSHLLAFGSADYKIYCYDLRNANAPWCVLAGHEKAVSYVKFVDSETLVSASTDNTLKLWDLKRSTSVGLSNDACCLTLSGHTNEKNFVGLSVADGYIACGSETNEVYTYHKSLPMPIISHKFGSIDPISGRETDDDNGQFVSSVCWKGKSNTIIAANSTGCIKVLRMF